MKSKKTPQSCRCFTLKISCIFNQILLLTSEEKLVNSLPSVKRNDAIMEMTILCFCPSWASKFLISFKESKKNETFDEIRKMLKLVQFFNEASK